MSALAGDVQLWHQRARVATGIDPRKRVVAVAAAGEESPRRVPVQLTPIPWGRRDTALARAVCQHIADFTPPTVIPHNPLAEERTRRLLRSLRIAHD